MYKLNIFLLLLLWLVYSEQKTKVTILYESLCPDSEVPLRNLQDGVGDFHKKQDKVDLELVPYGKASHTFSNGKWDITCHHGGDECVFNRYHACGLKYSPNQVLQLAFASCMMAYVKNIQDKPNVKQCSDYATLDYDKIDRCYNSESTSLLVEHGERTKPFKPLREVPTILYNDTFYEDLQLEARRDPVGTISKIISDDEKKDDPDEDDCCCCCCENCCC